MKMELVLPKLREEMQEAVLCSWVKSVGDKVEKGEHSSALRDRASLSKPSIVSFRRDSKRRNT